MAKRIVKLLIVGITFICSTILMIASAVVLQEEAKKD